MDVLIIAGLSKGKGGQFSRNKKYLLSRNNKVMHYANLQEYFGLRIYGPAGLIIR